MFWRGGPSLIIMERDGGVEMDECRLNIGKVWGGHGPRGYSWGLGVIQDLT